jgi:hypothetical protein
MPLRISRSPDRTLGSFLAILAGIAIPVVDVCPASSRSTRFDITRRGQPHAEIVVEAGSNAPLAFAAQELQRYVKQMSGAELRVAPAPSRIPAIVLTIRSLTQDKQAEQDPREIDHYRLKVEAKRIHIEGASARAVLFGVYDLLERLGCGWCVPGDDTIPKAETLSLGPLEIDARPAFRYRMMLDFPMQSVAQTIAIADWLAKNRMNWIHECPNAHGPPQAWYDRRQRVVPELTKRGLHLIVGGHTMHTWVAETNFASHPEWFAYEGGARKPPSLCLANAEMTSELIRNMQRFLNRCPEVNVVDLWHPDSTNFCHCGDCTRGVGKESAEQAASAASTQTRQAAYAITYIELVNRVARSIGKSHPHVMVGPLIYSQTDHAMPDGCPAPEDNVLLGLAHFFRDSYRPLVGEPKSAVNLRFLGNDLTWIAKAKHTYIYEYYNGWTAPYLYPGAQVIVRDLQTLQQLEVQGVSSDMYGYSPVNMYVAARALWTPGLSWEAVVRDFCIRYYGAVGPAMATNEIQLESGLFGLNGYQGNGARDPESPTRPASGRYLEAQRSGQIAFLKKLLATTTDDQTRRRLERALQPWSLWNHEPRFWAFPEFKELP